MQAPATVVNRYNLYLDSSQRDAGTPSDWSVNLTTPIIQSNLSNWFRLTVESVEIPYAWPAFRGVSVEATLTHAGGAKTDTLLFPDSNYTVVSFLDTLTGLLQGLATYAGLPTQLETSFSWSSSSLLVTLGLKTAGVTIELGLATSPVGRHLGFTNNINITSSAPATGVNPLNVSGSRCVYIRSRDLKPRSSYEALLQREDLSDILAKVPIGVNFGSFIMAAPRTVTLIQNDALDKLSFYVTDNRSREALPLQLDWSLSITIEEVGRPREVEVPQSTRTVAQLTQALLAERRQLEEQLADVREQLKSRLKKSDAEVL